MEVAWIDSHVILSLSAAALILPRLLNWAKTSAALPFLSNADSDTKKKLTALTASIAAVALTFTVDGSAQAGWTIHIPSVADLVTTMKNQGVEMGSLSGLLYFASKGVYHGGKSDLPAPQEKPQS